MKKSLIEFGLWFSKLRSMAGYESQRQLSLASGVANSTIARIESGQIKPSPNTLQKLAPCLHVPYEDLMRAAGYLPEIYELGELGANGKLHETTKKYKTEQEQKDNLPPGAYPIGETRKIPVIGTIRCGDPIYAYEDIQGWVDVPVDDLNGAEHFFLKVTGDSMTGSRIYPGDLVLIRRQEIVENGQVAVVIVNNEATLKRVKFMEEAIILYPDNPRYQPQIYKSSDIRIIGRVVKVEFRL